MNNIKSTTIEQLVDKVIDNRGRNPSKYSKSGYYILDNYLINNTRYPREDEVRRFIDQETHDIFLRKYLKKNDVCITLVGNGIGSTCMVPSEKWVTIQNTIGLRTNSSTDSAFLYYYLKLIKPSIVNLDRGSSQPSILQGDLLRLKIKVIDSYKQQQNIGAVLSALDDKIELNYKISAELEQMARMLYDYWFIQFDFPDAYGKPYKLSGGQMVYNDLLKREIPEGWKIQNMQNNDLFDLIKPKIAKFSGEKQYLATANVDNLNISNGSAITYENRETRANMQPKEYTVWFAKMKASVKHIMIGDYSVDLLQDAIFSTGFMGVQANRETFEYVALTIHRPYFELVKDANASGATMAAIGNNDMENIKIVVPKPSIITDFHKVVRPILETIDQNRQQSQKLAELRDWLLPMLMNGQIKVND